MRLIDADSIHYTRVLSQQGLNMELTAKVVIDDMPTIDAAPVKHGYWKYYSEKRFTVPISCRIVCSNCLTSMVRVSGENFKFCPHCGARMDEEKKHDQNQL